MPKINNHLVIMAGGVGSRFWPMSTAECPKQFIDVLGTGKTLLQLTVERFGSLVAPEHIWVVTNEKYADIVAEQLPKMPRGNILCEPCRRNTAPCIAYVSWRIKAQDPKANIVVTPSDHIVMNVPEFQRVIKDCMDFTADSDAIVTLGMKPSRPETGYGYIQADLSASSLRNKSIYRVDSFREKPDLKTAQQYIKKNYYFWNAGIFIWNVSTIVNAFRVYQPKMNKIFEQMLPIYGTPQEQEMINEKFPQCENISVDYAIMEKAEEIFVCPIRMSSRLRMERPGHLGLAAHTVEARHLRQCLHRQRYQSVRNLQLHDPHDSGEEGGHPGPRRLYRGREQRHPTYM